jgi:DNA-binding CsgD family transcriptional regulator
VNASTTNTNQPSPPGLTRREAEVYRLAIQGFTSIEIGKMLFRARKTVENHRYHALKKLRVSNATEACWWHFTVFAPSAVDEAHAKALSTLREEAERLRLDVQSEVAVRHMAVARLGGLVEGRPTHTGNFLQRIDELVRIEANAQRSR